MRTLATKQTGFSLVEVLAGLLIGLVTVVVIFQVLVLSEGYKRNATGTSEAVENGVVSMFLLERDIRQGGAGLDRNRFGDFINAADGATRSFDFTLAPVLIAPGAGNAADTITVVYANSTANGDIKKVASPGMANAGDAVTLTSSYGFNNSDLFIIAAAGVNGSLGQVTNIVANTLNHIDTGSGIRYNEDGFPVAYSKDASVMNLGPVNAASAPGLNQWGVTNNRLTVIRHLLSGNADTIADNVITVKAQYGLDTNSDNVVDTFALNAAAANGLPAGATFQNVRAIRLAVVTRVGAREKTNVSPASLKLWPDSTTAPITTGPTINLVGDERNFRYRVFTATVPLRNVIW